MALLVFILASAAFLSAITAMRIAIHGREVRMPNLVGKNVAEARHILDSRGLVLRVADHVYSDLPANVVIRQIPASGILMKVSQNVHVVISLGQRELQIPMLEGHSLRASRIELLRSRLQVGEVSNINTSPDTLADTVVLQNPKPGMSAATPRVDMLVSQGSREAAYIMPHLVGLNEALALHELDSAGLKYKETNVPAPQWPHGAITEQSPAAGARVAASSTVTLSIAN